jgi:hypothetical protein
MPGAAGTIGTMRPLAALLALSIAGAPTPRAASAGKIAVVDLEGKPVAGATSACVDASCRRVRCEAPGFLPGEAEAGGPDARCVVRPGAIVAAELPGSASGLAVRLVAPSSAGGPAAELVVPQPAPGSPSIRFELPAVRPARYALEISRSDGWTCRADLGPLSAGRHAVTPGWQEPATIAVRVAGLDGKPAPSVPLRALRRPAPADRRTAAASIGAWSCGPGASAPILTGPGGDARLPVDLQSAALLIAGDWKDPRGLAFATIDRKPAATLGLTLAVPVRVRATLEDDRDRPAACGAELVDLPADVAALAHALPGSSLDAPCDAKGVVTLGPIPAAPVTLEVRPRGGMPMRIPVDPPAAGTVADLGVLRVRNGESVRVVVQDDGGRPVAGAKVTVRGSAGIVLTVAGVTGEDGAAELSGLPKNAGVALDVKAKGFRPARNLRFDLESSPFTVKLSRGGSISGTVRDAEGTTVAGAEIALTGDKSVGRQVESSDPMGAFTFDGVDDGGWRLVASAAGYANSEPAKAEVEDHRSVEGVSLVLNPADAIAGHVVDGSGAAVGGARVRLVDGSARDDLDRASAIAEAVSASDGAYQLVAAPPQDSWLIATRTGYGPTSVRPPVAGSKVEDVVLTLGEPAALVVHIPQGARTRRNLRVRDGAGLGRQVPVSGVSDLPFTDLAAGRGAVGFVGGSDVACSLSPRQTAEVTLDPTAAIEGRVTFEGAPSARVYVRALRESTSGELKDGGGSFTDERGRYRIDGLASDSYRVAALGEDGRAETKLDVAEGETARADLSLRSVRLVVSVVDAADDKPLRQVQIWAMPGGASCSSSMGTTSWGDPGELGYEMSVGSNGCLSTQTDAAGVGKLGLAEPGSYDVAIQDDAFEPWKQSIAVVDGTTAKRVALTRKPDRPEDKPHVVASLRTDPPGQSGTIICAAGGNTSSSSPVAGRYDCGPMVPGPGEVAFHVDGYGWGRAAIEVPKAGELDVDVDVPRGGTLVAPVSQDSPPPPALIDGTGYAWADAQGRGRVDATLEDVPKIGRAWVFRDLPPGMYAVSIGGKARAAVPLASGGTAIAY